MECEIIIKIVLYEADFIANIFEIIASRSVYYRDERYFRNLFVLRFGIAIKHNLKLRKDFAVIFALET